MASSRMGTRSRSSSTPTPPFDAISKDEAGQARRPHVLDGDDGIGPAISSRQASNNSFSVNGSPTCTVGRLARPNPR